MLIIITRSISLQKVTEPIFTVPKSKTLPETAGAQHVSVEMTIFVTNMVEHLVFPPYSTE